MTQHNFTTGICSDARKLSMIVAGSLMCFLTAGCANAQQSKSTFTADSHTIMLLQPGPNGTLKDATGKFKTKVRAATTVNDPQLGQVLQFGKNGSGGSIQDGGKFDFSPGFTLDAWVKINQSDEKADIKPVWLFRKSGSFFFLIDNKRHVKFQWLGFPSQHVATTTDKQYKSISVASGDTYGSAKVPLNQWVRVAATYDPVARVARTWIDDTLVWSTFYPYPKTLPVHSNPANTLNVLERTGDASVGDIRITNNVRNIGKTDPFESYVLALPYRKKTAVILDHIDPSRLPLNVSLQAGNKQIQQFTLKDHERKVMVFDPPVAEGQKVYDLTINATANGKEVYSRKLDVYAGDDTKDPVTIDDENRLVINGKPTFPLMAYHTFIEDVPMLAKMGFTMFTPRYPGSKLSSLPTRDDKSIAIAKQFLDVAKANHIFMVPGGGIFAAGGGSTKINNKGIEALTNNPGLAVWYGADEPGSKRIEQLREGYVKVKQIGTRPILAVTNMNFHLQRLAETVDILSKDPYPIPNTSLRAVSLATEKSVYAVAGLKPVWTVIPQYGSKRPTEQELRSMAYLAIASGAQGLGIYAWDDRNAITKKGWYTKDHPEDLKILETVIGELSKMQDVLIIPNSARVLTLTPDNPAIHVVMKESGNEKYLFVVSDSRAAEEATLSIAGIQSADGVDMHDASKKLSIRGGKVLLQLPPLGARIYKLANVQSGG